jgi:hypothetical protein
MSPSPPRSSWPTLTHRLADVLTDINDGDFLIISRRDINHYVQVAGAGPAGWHAEAASNTYIEPPSAVLTVEQYEQLEAMGWQRANALPPELVVANADANAPHTGSPNFHARWAPNTSTLAMARVLTNTLRDVYRVPSPSDLVYKAFVGWGPEIRFPTLGLPRDRERAAAPDGWTS